VKFLSRTPIRVFVLYPIITLIWELIINRGQPNFQPLFLALILWGYVQYRWCGRYRVKHGGGGPGLDKPPKRLVSGGLYAYTRNPMYLSLIIFLTGLTLTLSSWLAALITIANAVWFHTRVRIDEKQLAVCLGEPYIRYTESVRRWVPGVF
jgi:protein-S-isoprenylcysteine O-methyltransferase Ste14